LAHVAQTSLDEIAARRNARPRRRLAYKTTEECYVEAR
jgi:IS30 family transposase